MAYALILLREKGYPCVFYGDYYGIPHDKVASLKELPQLLELRQKAAYGAQHDYFDNPSIVGWVRDGDEEHPNSGFALLMTINKGGSKKMLVGEQHAGEVYTDVLGNSKDRIVITKGGVGNFTVMDGSMSIWMPSGEKTEAPDDEIEEEVEAEVVEAKEEQDKA